jgi:hypothetical protein
MDEIATLLFISENPGKQLPPAAGRAITRLLRFQLIRSEVPGYALRSGGVETVIRHGPTPQWVRDAIERAREAHHRK